MKPGEELKDGPPIHGNTRLEVVLDGDPDGAAARRSSATRSSSCTTTRRSRPREIQIGVTGEQFAWTYQYPPSVTGGAPVNSDQLYLPKGESVHFNMHSKDVIHAFWIPAFRLQEDVVPGITTHWRATPDRLGSYPIVCNLLCGLGHSLMRSTVHVVSRAQFQAWIKSQLSASATAAPARRPRRRGGYGIMCVRDGR